jgi:hypothetical protein
LDCPNVGLKDFRVVGSDPHGFDGDHDGIGCESSEQGLPTPSPPGQPAPSVGNCDPSYPDVCIPPFPPDLDCPNVEPKDFRVAGSDPHGFDGDHDGIGCESSER